MDGPEILCVCVVPDSGRQNGSVGRSYKPFFKFSAGTRFEPAYITKFKIQKVYSNCVQTYIQITKKKRRGLELSGHGLEPLKTLIPANDW